MDQKVKELLLNEADNHKDRLVSLVSKLTQFDSFIGDEREVAHFVKDELHNIGLDVRTTDVDHELIKKRKEYIPMPEDTSYVDRPNVYGTLKGSGGENSRPLYLFGHTDVVPVDENTTWKYPPFSGQVDGDKIYGRGSADMKGGVGVGIVTLEILKKLNLNLKGDVTGQFVIEEEAGGNGTLFAALQNEFSSSGACIMLEPTGTHQVMVSNRGAQYFRITVPGTEGGTEYHREIDSAIDNAYMVINIIKKFSDYRESVVDHPLYKHERTTKVPTAVGRIMSGAWPSTIPGEAVLEGTIECLPGENIDEIVEEFHKYILSEVSDFEWYKKNKIKFEKFGLFFESGLTDPDHEFIKILSRSTEGVDLEKPKIIGGGGSDLRLPVNINNCPTVLFGPGGGPIHSVDEWVSIDQLVKMLKICLLTAVDWCELNE